MTKLMVHLMSTDPAGTVLRLSNAINRYSPDWISRTICTKRIDIYDWPVDLFYSKRNAEEILDMCQAADVFVLHKPQELQFGLRGATITIETPAMREEVYIDSIIGTRPQVFCHHGEPSLRQYPDQVRAAYERHGCTWDGCSYVVTPDLLDILPGSKFIPNVVPFDEPAILLGRLQRPNDVLSVIQAPTDTKGQRTVEVLEAVKTADRLQQEKNKRPRFTFQAIIGQPWRTALYQKRRARVGVDHFRGWWGLNACEFAAMGIPSVCNVSQVNAEHLQRFFGVKDATMPFLACAVEDLADRLLEWADRPQLLDTEGARAKEWMQRYWSNEVIAEAVVAMCEEAVERGERK